MKCDKTSQIVSWLKGEIAPSDRETLRIHFEGCPACSENLARYDRLLKAVGRMDSIEPSADFTWKVRKAFAADHPEFIEKAQGEIPRMTLWEMIRAQFEFVPAWAISTAAHLIFFAVVAIIFLSPPDPVEELKNAMVRSQPLDSSRSPEWVRSGGSNQIVGQGPDRYSQPDAGWSSESRPDRKDPIEPDKTPFAKENDPFHHPYKPKRWMNRLKLDQRVLAYLAPRTDSTLKRSLQKQYGGVGVDGSIEKALGWLAKTQEKDGRWEVKKHGGREEFEVGLTSLALLAFLADGHTPRSGSHRSVVKRGVEFLLSQQKSNGLVGSDQGNYLYNHAIAGMVLLEVWLMTGKEDLEAPAASAVAFTVASQNEEGGWGYRFREETSDTSVAGWQIMLLRLAFSAGDRSVIPALTLAHDRVEKSTNRAGKVGYRKPDQFPHGYHALTSVGMLSYLFSTHSPDRTRLEQQADLLRTRDPVVESTGSFENDLYFAYFGSLSLLQAGNLEKWHKWYEPLKRHLVEGQLSPGHWPSSFDKWSGYGGRIYTTALSVLILEVTWRYPRILD
jgi:hypothetical protein